MNESIKPYLASKNLYNKINNQQEYELDVFMDFALRLGIENFHIVQPKPPRPDIVMSILDLNTDKETVVGCELKDLYWDKEDKGSKEKRRFEKWKSFAIKLRKDLDNSVLGFEYLYGVLGLKNFTLIESENNQNKLSKEIIDFLKSYRLPININIESFDKNEFLNENLDYLRVETYAERGILWWEYSLLSGKTEIGLEIFDMEIRQKNEKNHDFSNCNKKWLLVFAEATNLGNVVTFPFHLMENRSDINGNHKFDKVFYFEHFSQNIYEISPDFKRLFSVEKSGQGIRHFNSFKEITK